MLIVTPSITKTYQKVKSNMWHISLNEIQKKKKKVQVAQKKAGRKWNTEVLGQAFGFQLRGGHTATFFSPPTSGFIWYQVPLSCCPSLTPMRSKSWNLGSTVKKSVPHLPWPPRSSFWSVSKNNVSDDITMTTGYWRVEGLQRNWPDSKEAGEIKSQLCHLLYFWF